MFRYEILLNRNDLKKEVLRKISGKKESKKNKKSNINKKYV